MLFLVLDTVEEVDLIEKLYDKYSKFMYKVTYNILHNNYDAEDAVQQALLKIIEHLEKINDLEDKKTRNFIGIICRNEAINIYNKSKKIREFEEDADIPDENYNVSLIVINKENIERIQNFIYSLDKKYQDILLLKSQYDYSINEIADILNIKPKTAQKRLERGRIKIKEFIEKEGKNYG